MKDRKSLVSATITLHRNHVTGRGLYSVLFHDVDENGKEHQLVGVIRQSLLQNTLECIVVSLTVPNAKWRADLYYDAIYAEILRQGFKFD